MRKVLGFSLLTAWTAACVDPAVLPPGALLRFSSALSATPRVSPHGEAPAPWLADGFDRFRAVRSGHRILNAAERRRIRDLYAGEVRQADANVWPILDALKTERLYDDAMTVSSSERGEEFRDHGGYEHGHTLDDELLRVPLLIEPPGSILTQRVRQRVPLEAVCSTFLAASHLAAGDGFPRPVPLLDAAGWDDTDRDFISDSELYHEPKIALTRNGRKYVLSRVTGEEELFDPATVPGETRSLASRSPELLLDMRECLQLHIAARDAEENLPPTPGAGVYDEMPRSLKSLGYVG